MILHIAETKDFSKEVENRLRKHFIVDFRQIEQAEVKTVLENCDIFWFRLGFKITAHELSDKTRCKVIATPVTGINHIDEEACKKKGIRIICLRGETQFLNTVRATAEHTIGLTLALLRKIPQAVTTVNKGVWNRDLFKGGEIFGKKVGIFGVGRLGTITAGFFKAMGAQVYGYDIKEFDASTCTKVNSLQELFAVSDILSIHVAYNQSTHHIVNKDIIAKAKPGAILINTARGGVIKSEDLVWALQNKTLLGAAIDVIEDEYNTHSDPLLAYAKQHDNLIITPHIGGNTYESFYKTENFIADKVIDYLVQHADSN